MTTAVASSRIVRCVAYYRVSTQQQGRSGLGLEAQQRAIRDFIGGTEGAEVVQEFTEVESGTRKDRPELAKALALAKRLKATLVVAKLDRLARNVAFVSALLEAGVEFKAADMPEANRFVMHLMAAMAEYEAKLIGERTKAGLAARKARGLPMGTPANLKRGNQEAAEANRADAQAEAERLRPVVNALRAEGIESIRQVCQALNQRGYLTARGCSWHVTTTARLIGRLGT